MSNGVERESVAASAAIDPRRAAAVFYDGGCPLCRAEISAFKKAAGSRVEWRDVSQEDELIIVAIGQEPVRRRQLLERFHVRRVDGRVVSGAAAFIALWRAAPKLSQFAKLLDNTVVIFFLDFLYQMFLTIRPLWRRSGRCD